MKKKIIACVIWILAAVLSGLLPAAAEDAPTARPKPTVRPQTIHYNYRLPSTKLSDENFERFFNIELGKEYSRGKHLKIPFRISPKEAYDGYDGSTLRIAVRLEISVFLTEDAEEPFYRKSYVTLLHRAKGFVDTGVIEVLVKPDQDEIWYTYEVIGCNGRVGLDGWEPEPEPATENETAPAE